MEYFVGRLIAIAIITAFCIAPAASEEELSESTLKFRRDYHSWYCPGKEACNACRIISEGKFIGHCTISPQQPEGSKCRCASSEGWLKGKAQRIDPVEGWGKP